jgi:hypothetical protein
VTTAGRSVLVLEPPFGGETRDACIDLLTDSKGDAAVLSVLYCESVAERMDLVERHSHEIDSAGIIRVGPSSSVAADCADHDAVRVVSDSADLTGLGIAITEWLNARSDPGRATVCIDSVSTLLQYADHDRVLKFLHTIASRLRRTGVDLHCHLDPNAHDDQTVAQLRQLFDEQRRPDSPGATAADAREVATDGGKRSAPSDGRPQQDGHASASQSDGHENHPQSDGHENDSRSTDDWGSLDGS